MTLKICQHDYHSFTLHDTEVPKLEEAVKIFETAQSWRLAAIALNLLARILKNEPELSLKHATLAEKYGSIINDKKILVHAKEFIGMAKK